MKPGCDPLGVGAGEQLFGCLAELQNLCQHGDSLVRVLVASQRKGTVSYTRDVKYVSELFVTVFDTYRSQCLLRRSVGETLKRNNEIH